MVFVRPAEGLSAADEPRVLRASLQLIQGLPCKHVHVSGWAASETNMQELQHLPQWEWLAYSQRQGSNPAPTALTHTASAIPQSYTRWMIDVRGYTQQQVEGFVRSLPVDRTAEQPLQVSVYNLTGEQRGNVVQRALTAAMNSQCPHPHVTITPGEPGDEEDYLDLPLLPSAAEPTWW